MGAATRYCRPRLTSNTIVKPRVGRFTADGHIRFPVTLLTEIVLDSRLGVFEQVLVDRPFPLEWRQLLQPIGWHGRAALEIKPNGHRQASRDRDHEIDRPAIVGRVGLERAVGLVVPPILQVTNVVVETLLDARSLKHLPGLGIDLAHDRFAGDLRVARHHDTADDGAWPRVDRERQDRAVRVMRDLGRRLYLGAEIPVIGV